MFRRLTHLKYRGTKQSQDSMTSLQILNPLASSSCLLCTFLAYYFNTIITLEKVYMVISVYVYV